MDPTFNLNTEGTGSLVFYAWGHSYEAEVVNWKVQLMPYQPPDGAVMRYAQRLVNRHFANMVHP